MAAKMLSTTEHWAGGTTKAGGLTAPVLALHTTDGGKTYNNEHAMVIGQMITAMDKPARLCHNRECIAGLIAPPVWRRPI